MHNLYIIFTCKVSVDAFSLLFSKLLLAKLCLFVFGAKFAAWHWQFISIRSCLFVTSVCLLLSVRGREGRS